MNWKSAQIKRESKYPDSLFYNLTLDSIGWYIPNYHNDKILKDILYNLMRKIYLSEDIKYIVKLNMLPEQINVEEENEEFEIMFKAIEKRSKK